MNKNTSKLKQIAIILLFIIIIAIGAYFDNGKENQTSHVLYRVTPYFESNNELASSVNIEGGYFFSSLSNPKPFFKNSQKK